MLKRSEIEERRREWARGGCKQETETSRKEIEIKNQQVAIFYDVTSNSIGPSTSCLIFRLVM